MSNTYNNQYTAENSFINYPCYYDYGTYVYDTNYNWNYLNNYQADSYQYAYQTSYQQVDQPHAYDSICNHTSPNITFQSPEVNVNKVGPQVTSSPKDEKSPVSLSNSYTNLDSSQRYQIDVSSNDSHDMHMHRRKHNQLPEEAVVILNEWFDSHINHPYPTMEEKQQLAKQTGIQVKQVNSWFCNRRNRSQNTKPKRIKRHLEQEITNVFNEFMHNPNKNQVIEKFKSTLKMHDIKL